jgi:hypothetical protein
MNVEYLAFGGGPPSLALMILNAWGEITPKADLVLFADTGAEKQETYDLLPVYQDWAAEMGLEFALTQAHMGSLEDRINNRLKPDQIPIPVLTETGMGKRICTIRWKIQPCEKFIRARYGRLAKVICQLGFTYEEAHRMRDAKYKTTTNRWPLIEKRLRRQDTIEIIKLAGLPVPPWTACYFCPLQTNGMWAREAAEHPLDFQKAVVMDASFRESGVNKYLHHSRRPLGDVFSADQLSFPLGNDGEIESCSDASCFT